MASVSLGGKSVEPQSLACAVDVTPGDFGGGPLGSAVLLEQIKQAGGEAATKDVSYFAVLCMSVACTTKMLAVKTVQVLTL